MSTSTTQQISQKTVADHIWLTKIGGLSKRLALVGDTVPLLLSIIVGLITGVTAYIFILLLRQASAWMAFIRNSYGLAFGIIVMALAGLIVGIIIDRFAKRSQRTWCS